MLLSEGMTIFQGSNSKLVPYFSNINIRIPPFTNPSDFLIKVAIDPSKVNSPLSLPDLASKATLFYQEERKLIDVSSAFNPLNINLIGEQRTSSFWL